MPGDESGNLDEVMREVELMEQEIVLSPADKGRIIRKYAEKAKTEGGSKRAFLFVRIFNICNAREEMTDGGTHINISGNVGVVNLGEIQGNINANVQALAAQGQNQATAADFIRRIATAIESTKSLSDSEKKEALEVVDALSVQAKEQPGKRSSGMVKSLLKGLPTLIAAASDVVTVWGAAGPYLTSYFGF